jgi:hypothetical protein
MSELQPNIVILAAYWDSYGIDKREYLQNTILEIHKSSPQSKIIIVGNVPIWPKRLYWYLIKKKAYLTGERYIKMPHYDKLKKLDKELSTTAHKYGAKFFSAIDVFCKADGSCKAITKFKKDYSLTAYDYGHFTEAGSKLLAIDLLKQIGNNKTEMLKELYNNTTQIH